MFNRRNKQIEKAFTERYVIQEEENWFSFAEQWNNEEEEDIDDLSQQKESQSKTSTSAFGLTTIEEETSRDFRIEDEQYKRYLKEGQTDQKRRRFRMSLKLRRRM